MNKNIDMSNVAAGVFFFIIGFIAGSFTLMSAIGG